MAGQFEGMQDPYKAKEERAMEAEYAQAESDYQAKAAPSMTSLAFERLSKTISQIGDLSDGFENRLSPVVGPSHLEGMTVPTDDTAVENRSPLVKQLDDANDRLARYARMLDSLLNRVQV